MARLMTFFTAVLIASAGAAQTEDEALLLPPEISSEPGEVRFEPPAEDRDDLLEAVVTGGQTDWRLPDLGTSLRTDEDKLEPGQRIDVSYLWLYDPENPDPVEELFPDDSVPRDVGMLQFIEVRIGGRDE